MALFHLSVTQTKRSAGQSAIASAAYRAGERLYSEYYGEYSDYTRKGGVICSDILLPSHAPPEYADRQTLWNAVEKAERGKNAQLAYSFDIALQNEFSLEENIALARQFLLENFVSRGMVVDFAVHQPDREDGGIPNPHFHVLCPIRPIEQNGKWGLKQRRVYELDEDGNRIRDADGKPGKGKFAQWFEEEYRKLIAKPRYDTLFHDVDTTTLPEKVHDGYFSIDKKGAAVDTSESTQAEKDNAERGYQLIMKNKTLLLSFDSPVKFIFSHSALKEGWDNPNVFQICTLNEISSDMRRRQMIGRGLRICVNQDGERVPGFEINTLTVMANESFQDFAENLQHEIEQEEEIKFGQVEEHSFANITIVNADGEQEYLGLEKSKLVYNYLKEQRYISSSGSVQETLKKALHDDRMEYPAEIAQHGRLLTAVLKKIAGKLNIKNKEEARTITLNKERFLSPEFKELWDRVKYKTTFRVDFDTDALVKACAEALADEGKLVVTYPKYIFGRGKVDVTKAGVMITDETGKSEPFTFDDFEYPDVISYLQNETNLTRKSIAQILIDSGRIEDFKKNPQMFIDGAIAIIKNVMSKFVVDGIKYHKLGNDNIWAQELFESEEVSGYLNSNMVATPNSGIYEYTVYDSDIEREFAEKLDANEDVKVFAKLPDWFKIPTPLGNYNPDWAILVEKDGQDRLYFVVETKGTDLFGELPPPQQAKIKCGRAHFAALQEDGIVFEAPVASYDRFDDIVNKKIEKNEG